MARIRTIKPSFWTDEKITDLPPLVRLTFLGLISAMSDDAGRCKGDLRLLKAAIWPLDDDISTATLEEHVEQLERARFIAGYVVDGKRYFQIINFLKHQRIDKPKPSELAAPPANLGTFVDNSTTRPRIVVDASPLEGDTEGNRKGSGTDSARPVAAPTGETVVPLAPLAAVLSLSPDVRAFLGMFYEPALTEAQRARYRDVVSQIGDAIDPNHPGPKIRGGVRVKVRSLEHLDFVCRRVMKDPPMDRDKAIVFVLKQLLDPMPGPTPAEVHKVETDERIGAEDAYHRAMKAAGVKWAREHPEEYQPILTAIDREYDDPSNAFARMARDSALSQRCARAAGFPDFNAWNTRRQESAA